MSVQWARKRFGQHFLVDPLVITQIVDLIAPLDTDYLVEIGPGRGALTALLVGSGVHLDVIEIDRDLAALIAEQFADQANFKIHLGDALRFDYSLFKATDGVRVVGNLPYNISTPLIFKLIEQGSLIKDMTFMLQKEVVDRLAANPGSKDYGRLSVIVQAQAMVNPGFEVPPMAFDPPPKVTSKLVCITPQSLALSAPATIQLERLVRLAFSQRRKTLKNTLGKEISHDLLEKCGIGIRRRAEEIAVGCYVSLARELCAS